MHIDKDFQNVKNQYQEKYDQHGYSLKSLKMDKGKQDIRFDVLTSQYDCNGKSILDIGCGFGDLNRKLKTFDTYSYLGIDLVDDFIKEAESRYLGNNIRFECANIFERTFDEDIDYAIGCGIFNMKFLERDNYDFVEAVMDKIFGAVNDGFAFDFLSDKVDYTLPETFHYSPEKILSMAYKLSRNVILRNDYMPFEFALFVFKDDSFLKEDTLFCRYKKLHGVSAF